ncbi:hypothetical protein V8F33_001422 [Rhypophila sp. PSN 637]
MMDRTREPRATSVLDTVILRSTLKLNSITAIPSSYEAQVWAAANGPAESHDFVQIGAGFQGAIFEQLGSPLAFKKEHPGNSQLRTSLENEFALHKAVREAFDLYDSSINSQVQVPCLHGLIRPDENEFWSNSLGKFPPEYQNRDLILKMDRILPLPKITRRALVSYFHPTTDSKTAEGVYSNPESKHCLVRTYLGTSKPSSAHLKPNNSFSLRNFPLTLSHMSKENLNLNTHLLAEKNGKGLCDNALGRRHKRRRRGIRARHESSTTTSSAREQHRETKLFLLDFGQCDGVDLLEDDTEDVYQAFKGAMVTGDNQLFIPHLKKTPELWAAFRKGYLMAGQLIIEKRGLGSKFSVEGFLGEYEEYAEDFLE